MSQQTIPRWKSMRTDETRQVEKVLRPTFPQTDAYRYNSASIRIRIIDPRFAGLSPEQRDAMVEPILEQLPATTQADLINLLTLAPDEVQALTAKSLSSMEFENPSPSTL